MRAVGGADALVERECLEIRGQPAGAGRGVLREEADELARRPFRSEVAGAPVREILGCDLEQLDAGRAGYLARAVAGARVDHEDLRDSLARESREQLFEVALPVLDGDHGGDVRHDLLRLRRARLYARATDRIARSAARSSAAPGLRISAFRSRCQRSSQ